jgi:hypothetical protein
MFFQGCTAREEDEDLGALLLIDTAGCDMEELQDEEGDDSKCNQGEAKVVMTHCARLVAAGVSIADIGVITPYNAQAHLTSRSLRLAEVSPHVGACLSCCHVPHDVLLTLMQLICKDLSVLLSSM